MNVGVVGIPANKFNAPLRSFLLQEIVPALSKQYFISHPFDGVPMVSLVWRCIAADNGWQPGDRILGHASTTGSQGVSIAYGIGQLILNTSSATLVAALNKATNVTATITPGSWVLEVRAIG